MTMTTASQFIGIMATLWSGGLLILAIILSAHVLVSKFKKPKGLNNFYSLINRMPNPVLYFQDSRCQFANPAFYRMTGETRVRGQYFLDYFSESDKNKIRLLTYQTNKEGRQTLQYEAQLKTKNGSTIPIKVAVILDNVPSDQLGGYLVIYNKTRENDLALELEKSNKLRAAGQLASQIAHDFNNLLTPLQSYPYLIKISLPEGHKAIEYAEHLEELSYRMTDLNQQLLSMGRRYKQKFIPLDMTSTIKDIVSSARVPDSVKLTLELPDNNFKVDGNSSQLSRVFLNLINNALDSMNDEGDILITAHDFYVDTTPPGFPNCKEGRYLKIDIKDTGKGIESNIIKDIFQPFFTTKNMDGSTGSGLGLTIAKEIVSDHLGFITVNSEKNNGTTFSVYLPIYPESEPEQQVSDEQFANIFAQYKKAACY